jgi:hypothetical protein
MIYRRDEKLATIIPLSHWCKHGLGLMKGAGGKRSIVSVTTVVDDKLKRPCVIEQHRNGEQFFQSNDPMIFRTTSKTRVQKTILKSTLSLNLTAHQQDFVRGFFNQYSVNGLPLEYTDFLSDGTTASSYTTSNIATQAVPPNFWVYPTKFTLTSSIKDVFASNKDVSQMGAAIKSFLGEDTLKQKDLSKF